LNKRAWSSAHTVLNYKRVWNAMPRMCARSWNDEVNTPCNVIFSCGRTRERRGARDTPTYRAERSLMPSIRPQPTTWWVRSHGAFLHIRLHEENVSGQVFRRNNNNKLYSPFTGSMEQSNKQNIRANIVFACGCMWITYYRHVINMLPTFVPYTCNQIESWFSRPFTWCKSSSKSTHFKKPNTCVFEQ